MFPAFNNSSLKSISNDRDHTGFMGEQITEDRPYIFALGKAMERFFLDPVINWKSSFGLGAAGERKGEYHKGFQTIIAMKMLS